MPPPPPARQCSPRGLDHLPGEGQGWGLKSDARSPAERKNAGSKPTSEGATSRWLPLQYAGGGVNPHALRHIALNHACLPVPAPAPADPATWSIIADELGLSTAMPLGVAERSHWRAPRAQAGACDDRPGSPSPRPKEITMRIVVDAMGSDRYPIPDVEGAVLAARAYGVEIILVGGEGGGRPALGAPSPGKRPPAPLP